MATVRWEYQSAKPLVITLMILFAIGLLLDLVLGATTFAECLDLQKQANGNPAEENVALLFAQGGASLLWMVVLTITIIVFCVWIYRANANARSLGAADLSITPGWSVGWFFVPFANLFKPFVAVKEIWNASKSDPNEVTAMGGASFIVGAWWSLWIVSNILGQTSFRMTMNATTPEEHLRANYVALGNHVLDIGLFVFVVLVVQGIQSGQDQLYESVWRLRRRQEAEGTPQLQSPW
jgi:uncharacterized protein DUF4328